MSAPTEHVPPADLEKGDFVTLTGRDGEQVFATVARVNVLDASDRILVDYYVMTGGVGTVDLGPDDLVMRVREEQAS